MEDAEVFEDRVFIHLWRAKTDQAGKGHLIILGFCSVAALCLVRVLHDYLFLCQQGPGALLCHNNGSPLMKLQFWKVTSQAFQSSGIEGWKCGTHSFCIGVASTAATLGYNVEQIQRVGQ